LPDFVSNSKIRSNFCMSMTSNSKIRSMFCSSEAAAAATDGVNALVKFARDD